MMLVQSQAYREQYRFNSIVLFPVNLYGPRDNFDLNTSHVIPALIRKCVTAREADQPTLTLWGDGSPTREFLYVEDATEGILQAAEHYEGSLPVNLGTGEEVTIRNLAAMIAKEAGFTGQILWDTTKPNGQPRRCLDVSRAKQLFGFQAKHLLGEGLKMTMEWFLANRNNLRQVTFSS
jgi:GDP-L-fucose synthase